MATELNLFSNFLKILNSDEQRELLAELFKTMADWSEWTDDRALYQNLNKVLFGQSHGVRKKLARIIKRASKRDSNSDRELVWRLRGIGRRENE